MDVLSSPLSWNAGDPGGDARGEDIQGGGDAKWGACSEDMDVLSSPLRSLNTLDDRLEDASGDW